MEKPMAAGRETRRNEKFQLQRWRDGEPELRAEDHLLMFLVNK